MTSDAVSASTLAGRAHGVFVLANVIVDCNDRFCGTLQTARAALVGKSPLDISPRHQADGAQSVERWQRRLQAARAGLKQWFPWQFRSADGRPVHTLVHLGMDPRAAGHRLVADVHDLSNLAHAGWVKPGSEARLQHVLDNTKAVIFVKDREGRYIFANRELERAVRMSAEKIVGHTDYDIWPRELAERFRASDARVLADRSASEFEVTTKEEARPRTFHSFKFPLFDAHGEPYAVCGIATDITNTKRTEEALTSAALAVSSAQGASVFQELVRYLATILQVDCAVISTPGANTACNMRVHAFFLDGEIRDNFEYAITGTPCESVLGHEFRMYSSRLRERFPADLDIAKAGFESYAGFPLNDTKGEVLGLISVMSRSPIANAQFVESILKIFAVRAAAELERQRAEDALRVSESSYRAIFEASEDAIFIHDWETGAIVDVNPRACVTCGYSYDEMKRISVGDLSSGEHPYTGEEAAKRLLEAKSGKTSRFEWRRRKKDGSLHWDEVVLRPAVIAGERRILAFTREITERKNTEQAMRQAQKMEALGHLTGGIAHDFNNLLTSIMGYIVLCSEQPTAQDDAKLGRYLEHARLSCERARDLIQQMLTFSRGQRGAPRPLSLPPLVRESVKLFRSSLPSTVEIETEIARNVPAVMLDPVHLDQILLNLCLNARDAMDGVGTISVSVAEVKEQSAPCTACRQTARGNYVELRVEDNGPGIAPEIIDRIFEPFFTTKEVGKGTGMGLATVHGIVHEQGGHLVVESTRGHGTCMRVLLPPLATAAASVDAPRGSAPSRGTRVALQGRVLVVDDEPAVGEFMRDLLESWGLDALFVTSGGQACAVFAREKDRFDVVITDQTMPRMTGLELAGELSKLQDDLPIILYSGYNEGLAKLQVEQSGVCAVISKPVDPQQLLSLLKTHLRTASAER
ncbi:MAG: PAS domain S-box protein [Burkholderiales bacterium]